jgi:hypothetical protein
MEIYDDTIEVGIVLGIDGSAIKVGTLVTVIVVSYTVVGTRVETVVSISDVVGLSNDDGSYTKISGLSTLWIFICLAETRAEAMTRHSVIWKSNFFIF